MGANQLSLKRNTFLCYTSQQPYRHKNEETTDANLDCVFYSNLPIVLGLFRTSASSITTSLDKTYSRSQLAHFRPSPALFKVDVVC